MFLMYLGVFQLCLIGLMALLIRDFYRNAKNKEDDTPVKKGTRLVSILGVISGMVFLAYLWFRAR